MKKLMIALMIAFCAAFACPYSAFAYDAGSDERVDGAALLEPVDGAAGDSVEEADELEDSAASRQVDGLGEVVEETLADQERELVEEPVVSNGAALPAEPAPVASPETGEAAEGDEGEDDDAEGDGLGALLSAASVMTAQSPAGTPSIVYSVHVQGIGWMNSVSNGALAGTTGKAKRLEAIKIGLAGASGGVQYQLHVQRDGWQNAVANNAVGGTTGRSLRIEALRIALTGDVSTMYDVTYRVHVQSIGWMDWMKNGELAGTTGQAKRIEAIEIKLDLKKAASEADDGIVAVRYQPHVQTHGWMAWSADGSVAGTTGQAKRVEAVRLELSRGTYASGNIEYRTHVQSYGWQSWVKNGALSGTTGRAKRVEAIEIKLSGDIAKDYEVVYRAHVQSYGWQPWVSGGMTAGTTGQAKRVEAIEIKLVRKPTVPVPTQTVSDGLYAILPSSQRSLAVSVASASDSAGANVELGGYASWHLQDMWSVTWKGNGYELTNANSGKVLEAANGAVNLMADLKQANRSNATSQRWAIIGSNGTYRIVGMNRGSTVSPDGSLSSGANLHLAVPEGSAQTFAFVPATAFTGGTYQLFTKVSPSNRALDTASQSLSNNAKMVISAADDSPGQHFMFEKSGNAFTIRSVASGKYLTASGNDIVQASKSGSSAQLWTWALSPSGGLTFTNVSTGKNAAVAGGSSASGTALTQAGGSSAAAQRWYPMARSVISTGLYEMQIASASLVGDVRGASFASGSDLMVYSRNQGNNQKFVVTPVSDGYYRISMPLANTAVTVQGSSKSNGANVRMETYSAAASQLWKPVVSDGGLQFQNKASGLMLAATATSASQSVVQKAQANDAAQKWALKPTALNANDLLSYRNVIDTASNGRSASATNGIYGYSISQSAWNGLVSALNRCYSNGIDIGFVLADCETGLALSANADMVKFGASTIKGLYVTYLFEEYLEKGRLSRSSVAGLIERTIVWSDNDAYRTLRYNYGSQAGFDAWLAEAGLGGMDLWPSYSARTLAKAWTQMHGYANSNGSQVGYWKSVFNHSYMSSIHDALAGSRTVYSKPGWMEPGTWSGCILNDGGFVEGANGKQYIVSVISNANPGSQKWLVEGVVRALDTIQSQLPARR